MVCGERAVVVVEVGPVLREERRGSGRPGAEGAVRRSFWACVVVGWVEAGVMRRA